MNLSPAQARRVWMMALRSGKYKQGSGPLRDGVCCSPVNFKPDLKRDRWSALGVACCEFARHEQGTFTFKWQAADLNDHVRDWLGLRDNVGAYGRSSLACDNATMSFGQLANLIESRPTDLLADE